jgi:hypothetical protein
MDDVCAMVTDRKMRLRCNYFQEIRNHDEPVNDATASKGGANVTGVRHITHHLGALENSSDEIF